jgi:hypothetical protein
MLQERYWGVLWKVDPRCAVALLGERFPRGVSCCALAIDHACCQLLCNVRPELGRDLPPAALPKTAAGEREGESRAQRERESEREGERERERV